MWRTIDQSWRKSAHSTWIVCLRLAMAACVWLVAGSLTHAEATPGRGRDANERPARHAVEGRRWTAPRQLDLSVWGPKRFAETRQGLTTIAILDLSPGMVWCARFETINAPALMISWNALWFGPGYAPSVEETIHLEVRQASYPHQVVDGWTTEVAIPRDSGKLGRWLFERVAGSSPLFGSYWVCGRSDANNVSDKVSFLVEREVDPTWSNFLDRYIERNGLMFDPSTGAWQAGVQDAEFVILEEIGYNEPPTAAIDSATTDVTQGDDVVLQGSGTDDDGYINGYEWSLRGEVLGKAGVFVSETFDPGTHEVRFRVKDDKNVWSGYQTVQIRVAPIDPPIIGELQDGSGTAALSNFVSGMNDVLPLTNTYHIFVDPNQNPGPDTVTFSILESGVEVRSETTTSGTSSGWWYAALQVSDLDPGSYTVVATAENTSGSVASEPKTFQMLPAPPWWNTIWVGGQSVTYDSTTREYVFTGWIPFNPQMYYEVDPPLSFPFLGDLENSAGLRIDVEETVVGTDPAQSWSHSAAGGVSATLLGQRIFDQPFDLQYKNGRYRWSWTSPTLLDYSANIYDGQIFSGTVGPVFYRIMLSVDFGMEVDLTVSGDIAADLRPTSICITPGLTAEVSFDASADIYYGAATVGLIGTPQLDFDLPICYEDDDVDPDGVYLPGPCITFRMLVEAYVKVAWGLGEWSTGQYELGSLPPWGDGCDVKTTEAASQTPSELPPLHSPRIASDGAGNAMVVWIHDPLPPGNPDVYFSYFAQQTGSWSPPAPVATTALYETDPRVVFTGAGQALLVATQNQLTQTQAENAQPAAGFHEWEVIMAEQELVSYVFDGTSWAYAGHVHHDTPGVANGARADGRCELAAGPSGSALAVWARDMDGRMPSSTNPSVDTAIYASTWNGIYWTPARQLSDVPGAHLEPDVAFGAVANAVAVWVIDADGDPVSIDDRSIVHAAYDHADPEGQRWSLPAQPVVTGRPGLLWPTVYLDQNDRPVVVFTQRGPNATGSAPGGNPYGEGVDDYLYSAGISSTAKRRFPFNFDQVHPIGGPNQNRGRWPRATVLHAGAQSTAFVAVRSFKGTGADGMDGEVGVTMRLLEDPSEHGALPSPTHLTSDRQLDWQIDVDADDALSVLRVVWVKPSTNNLGAPFGSGFDGIMLLEQPLGSDLAVYPAGVSLSTEYPQSGETVTVRAGVRNVGNEVIQTVVTVAFYLDEIDAGSRIGQTTIAPPYELQSLRTVVVDWTADGRPHDLIVVVDPDDSYPEVNEENNQAEIRFAGVDPPRDISVRPTGDMSATVLSWEAPPADPAASAVVAYRVYRDSVFLAETTSTLYIDRDPNRIAWYEITAVTGSGAESEPAGRSYPGPGEPQPRGRTHTPATPGSREVQRQ